MSSKPFPLSFIQTYIFFRFFFLVRFLETNLFKKYNDFYGHQAGDNCLIIFANTIRENLHRQCDFVARYSGEEFVVIVSDCDKKNILNLANILKEKIFDLKLPHELSEFGYITASFGTTAIIPDGNNIIIYK